MAGTGVPEEEGENEEGDGDDGDEWRVFGRHGAAKQADRGVIRREAERDDPAQKKLHDAAVNRERIAAEGDHVPHGRVNADAILPPEGDRGENQKHGNVNDARAAAEKDEEANFGERPDDVEASARINHAEDARGDFLHGLDAKRLEQHLEEGRDGAQQHAVKFAFDDVCVAEVVEIEADDVEDAVGNERKAVEEENFLEAPSGELGRFLKKNDDEEQRENRGGKAREQADDEVAAIADANDRVLREVIVEEQRVAFDADEERIWRGRRCCHYQTRLAQRECSCFVVFFALLRWFRHGSFLRPPARPAHRSAIWRGA